MDKYRRVEKNRQGEEPIKENEIRVTTQGKMRSSISYATSLFQVRKIAILLFSGFSLCRFRSSGYHKCYTFYYHVVPFFLTIFLSVRDQLRCPPSLPIFLTHPLTNVYIIGEGSH
jgi:hypothetical protein